MKILGKIIGQCDEEEGLLKKTKTNRKLEKNLKLQNYLPLHLGPVTLKLFMVVINSVVQ
jgi:hypothetical protein